jgi:hypothetical protein
MIPFVAKLVACFALGCAVSSGADSTGKEGHEWQTRVFPRIGLTMQLPLWKSEIEDQDRMWVLLAYPLADHPVADVQYRVLVSVSKLTKQQQQRNRGTNSLDWINLEHLQTSEMTNALWIYARRDVVSSNGFAYICTGRVKRSPSVKSDAPQQMGEQEKVFAAGIRRILDSIEVVSTNALNSRASYTP